jgi:hypothetical protein
MPKEDSLLGQYRHEIDTWKRELGFMQEENIILKNRLSEILTSAGLYEESMLERLENFQSEFLSQDNQIRRLQVIIMDEQKLLMREIFEDGQVLHLLKSRQRQLRHEMAETELSFQKLKTEFNIYLSQDEFPE